MRGCKSSKLNTFKRGGKNNRGQGAKGVKSVIKSTRRGKFSKRIINKEDRICERRGEKSEKRLSEDPRVLER